MKLLYNSLLLLLFLGLVYAEKYIFELSTPVKSFLKDIDNKIQVRHVYDSDILNGFSAEFSSSEKAQQFKTLKASHILKSWPILDHTSITKNIKNIKKKESPTFFVPQHKDTLKQLTRANYGYKKLNVNGSGIKVGLVDSGIDYTHPALGGCFGKGCKVAYGYDLVGNNYNGTTASIKPSHDPLDNCPTNSTSATGHGTFLAGLIAAEDKEYNWTGVAPGVTLGMWKVYSCNYGLVPNDILIKAVQMAYEAGMDIINLSLGLHGGWEEEALATIISRIAAKGVHIVSANGNIGTNGIFLGGSPATGKEVIAVGSVNNEQVPGYLMKVHSKNTFTIPYRTYPNTPLTLNKTLSLSSASTTFNKTNDACKPLKEKFNNTILLVHQSNCSMLLQVQHAKKAGARVVLFYSDLETTAYPTTLYGAVLPVAFINNEQGRRVFKAIKQSKKVQAQMTNVLVSIDAPVVDLLHRVSFFSSQGPTNELQLKPELMGVGGNVFSTYPKYLKHYGFNSGTSFAAPFVSGQIALLLAQKKMKPEETKRVLMNFATQVQPPISDWQYGDSPIRQGAGMSDVVRAVHGLDLFHAMPAFLGLNDTAHMNQTQEITFYNHHSTPLHLNLTHLPSLTAEGYKDYNKNKYTPSEPVTLLTGDDSVACVSFSQQHLTIPAGKTAKVTLHFKAPTKRFNQKSHALYGGYIQASSGQNKITVPYLGMVGNMKDLPILDRLSGNNTIGYPFPSIGLPTGDRVLLSNETGHFVIKHYQNGTITGTPYVLTRLLTGTRALEIQIMKKNKVMGDFPVGSVPMTWLMRNTLTGTQTSTSFYSWPWNGKYLPKDSNSAKLLKKGNYRFRVRGLKVFGNPKKKEDWDVWTSPQFKLINHVY
ncbi:hypothetical protein CU098_010979 [Rhizopus stolonifer]|uniref:Peptidase S8/S53 domain-containing protein n=1 Tax=Rhizopus stolonifer TaxID=4846 RepID=A0A367KMB0_RHIST|nr:hypothetical protein CU098_010979 [Rhizopus stolonifer]